MCAQFCGLLPARTAVNLKFSSYPTDAELPHSIDRHYNALSQPTFAAIAYNAASRLVYNTQINNTNTTNNTNYMNTVHSKLTHQLHTITYIPSYSTYISNILLFCVLFVKEYIRAIVIFLIKIVTQKRNCTGMHQYKGITNSTAFELNYNTAVTPFLAAEILKTLTAAVIEKQQDNNTQNAQNNTQSNENKNSRATITTPHIHTDRCASDDCSIDTNASTVKFSTNSNSNVANNDMNQYYNTVDPEYIEPINKTNTYHTAHSFNILNRLWSLHPYEIVTDVIPDNPLWRCTDTLYTVLTGGLYYLLSVRIKMQYRSGYMLTSHRLVRHTLRTHKGSIVYSNLEFYFLPINASGSSSSSSSGGEVTAYCIESTADISANKTTNASPGNAQNNTTSKNNSSNSNVVTVTTDSSRFGALCFSVRSEQFVHKYLSSVSGQWNNSTSHSAASNVTSNASVSWKHKHHPHTTLTYSNNNHKVINTTHINITHDNKLFAFGFFNQNAKRDCNSSSSCEIADNLTRVCTSDQNWVKIK